MLIKVTKVLAEKHFKIFFDVMSKCFVESRLDIKYFLGADYGISITKGVLFSSEEGNNIIYNYIKENPHLAQNFANIIPIYDEVENGVVWNKLCLNMLNDFIKDKDFFYSFNSHFSNFGYVGSAIPHYNNRLSLLSQLTTHKNADVKNWAKSMTPLIEERLEREKMQEVHRYD